MNLTRTVTPNQSSLIAQLPVVVVGICMAHAAAAGTPNGVGIYLNNVVVGTYGYVGNGSANYASGPGISISNAGGMQASGGPLYGVTSAPLLPGATAGTLASAGTSDAGHDEAAQSSATADLSSGLLRVNSGGSARGLAEAELADKLTFQVSGGGTRNVTVNAHLDGFFSLTDPSYASASQSMQLDFAGATFYEVGGATDVNGYSDYHGHSGPSNNVPPQGWLSYSFSHESITGFDFTGVLQVSDGQHSSLALDLSTDCNHATCAFDHTGTISFVLPTDVTFTSDSGVFLTAGPLPVAAVPEPESWALMLGGLGSMVALARRRTKRR